MSRRPPGLNLNVDGLSEPPHCLLLPRDAMRAPFGFPSRPPPGRLRRRLQYRSAFESRSVDVFVEPLDRKFGMYSRSTLYPLLSRINAYLMRSARNTNGYAPSERPRAVGNSSPASIRGCSPTGHGRVVPDGQDDKSAVTTDCHAGICGSRTTVSGHLTQQRGTMRFRTP
jgi:hypothetical protein